MKRLSVRVATWNVADEPGPLSDHSQWMELLGFRLFRDEESLPDILAIGLQESRRTWRYEIKKTMVDKGYVLLDHSYLKTWTKLGATGHSSYIELFVLIKMEHLPYINNVDKSATSCGLWNVTSNKGGVSVRAEIYSVQMVFVNAHLEAHVGEEFYKQRVMQFGRIIDKQKFTVYERPDGDKHKYNILDHDYVFWLGDLNFRIRSLKRDDIIDMVERNHLHIILPYDELKMARETDKLIDSRFQEGQIQFPPTYKYDKNTDEFDTSDKQRKPAYCDRILWFDHPDDHNAERALLLKDENIHIDHNLEVTQQSYDSLHQFRLSDHKPVVSRFAVTVYPLMEAIVFDHPTNWYAKRTNNFRYTKHESVRQTKDDWIGLYRNNFYDHTSSDDLVSYVKVKNTSEGRFHSKKMKVRTGFYRLAYVNGNWEILGLSREFEIETPPMILGDQGSDDEGESSDSGSSIYTTATESDSENDDSDQEQGKLLQVLPRPEAALSVVRGKGLAEKRTRKKIRKLKAPEKSKLVLDRERERKECDKYLDTDRVKRDISYDDFIKLKDLIYVSQRFSDTKQLAKVRLSSLKSRLSVEEPRHASEGQLRTSRASDDADDEGRPASQAASSSPYQQKHTEL